MLLLGEGSPCWAVAIVQHTFDFFKWQPQAVWVSRSGGKGIDSGVKPLFPPGVLLLEASACFVHTLLFCCLCALRACAE